MKSSHLGHGCPDGGGSDLLIKAFHRATIDFCARRRGVGSDIVGARQTLILEEGPSYRRLLLRHDPHPDDVRPARYAFDLALDRAGRWRDEFVEIIDWTIRYERAFGSRREMLGGEAGEPLPPEAWATHPVAAAVLRLHGQFGCMPTERVTRIAAKHWRGAPRVHLPDSARVVSVVVAAEGLQLRLVRALILCRHGQVAATFTTSDGILTMHLLGDYPEMLESALPGRPAGQLLDCLADDAAASHITIAHASNVAGRGLRVEFADACTPLLPNGSALSWVPSSYRHQWHAGDLPSNAVERIMISVRPASARKGTSG